MYAIKLISTLKTGNLYLDPGSGSLLLQLLISGLLGVGVFFLSKVRAIRKFFQKNDPDADVVVDDIEEDIFDD
jgi:hypothetical protein